MNVLETFFFQFASDASKLDAGLKASRDSNKKLGAELNDTDDIAEKLGAKFEKLAKQVGETAAALFALEKIKQFTENVVDNTYAVSQQAKAMAISVETLSTWQQAVKASGGTAEGATASMKGLQDKFIEMSRFGGMMGPDAFMFEKLGLSAKDMHDSIKDPMIALQKLAGTFQGLTNTQQQFLGKKLGLDIGTIALLAQGRRGMDEMIAKQKELGIVTAQQALATEKFKLQLVGMGMELEGAGRQIISLVLPAITWLLEKIEAGTEFFRQHKVFATAFFASIAAGITLAYLPAIVEATVATWAWAAATLAATWPFLLIGVAILAIAAIIALVVDDIYAFMHGQDSLIGEAVKKWPILGEIFKAIGQIISMTVDAISEYIKFLIWLVSEGVPNAFRFMHDKVTGFMDMMAAKFPWLAKIVKFLSDNMKSAVDVMIAPWKFLWEMIKKVFDLLTNAPIAVINFIGRGLASLTGGHYDDIGGGSAATPQEAATNSAKGITDHAQGTGSAAAFANAPPEAIAAAKATEAKYGVPAAVTLAQFKLESDNGKHMPTGSNNPFGIKARAGEAFVDSMTTEHINGVDVRVMQRFKKFDSLADAFEAHAKLLATSKHYANARKHADDPNAYADALTGVYATDPNYGTKLKKIMAEQNANTGARASMSAGSAQINAASGSPINSINSQTIANSQASRTNTTHVDVGGVTVHTQATDADTIAKHATTALGTHMKSAVDQYDDGVAI